MDLNFKQWTLWFRKDFLHLINLLHWALIHWSPAKTKQVSINFWAYQFKLTFFVQWDSRYRVFDRSSLFRSFLLFDFLKFDAIVSCNGCMEWLYSCSALMSGVVGFRIKIGKGGLFNNELKFTKQIVRNKTFRLI